MQILSCKTGPFILIQILLKQTLRQQSKEKMILPKIWNRIKKSLITTILFVAAYFHFNRTEIYLDIYKSVYSKALPLLARFGMEFPPAQEFDHRWIWIIQIVGAFYILFAILLIFFGSTVGSILALAYNIFGFIVHHYAVIKTVVMYTEENLIDVAKIPIIFAVVILFLTLKESYWNKDDEGQLGNEPPIANREKVKTN